jgi:putative Holliday junction resolvase
MSTILGIDYGTRVLGIAIADETSCVAVPSDAIRARGESDAFRAIDAIIRERDVARIVVGLPLALSGNETPQTRAVRAFAKKLHEHTAFPVHLIDERLSSVEAMRSGRSNVDSRAAALILQRYCEQARARRGGEQ